MHNKRTFLKMKVRYVNSSAFDTFFFGKVKEAYFVRKTWKNPYNPLRTSEEIHTYPDFEEAVDNFLIYMNVRKNRGELSQDEISAMVQTLRTENDKLANEGVV